ncbi:MAG TPA: hypothetical protein PKZ53_10505 [Acidobacteriota bacterium]|nr:hypothetical protein [Acidobacteriota bacterium]HNG95754.1 hypothetical protein [Acidobacteriota bacterium]HNJ40910.1 hypothetical protein [Acidobacteriota bacterium]
MESSRWSRSFGRYHRITAQFHLAPGWALEDFVGQVSSILQTR